MTAEDGAGLALHTCPRRRELGLPRLVRDADRWELGHGLVGQDEIGPSCSWCGSLHPDWFMRLVGDGWLVEPTDKTYKAYLARPFPQEDMVRRREYWEQTNVTARVLREEAASEEEARAAVDKLFAAGMFPEGDTVAKFYYQHLSREQQEEFVGLINAGRMRIAPPGRFYVAPFFVRFEQVVVSDGV